MNAIDLRSLHEDFHLSTEVQTADMSILATSPFRAVLTMDRTTKRQIRADESKVLLTT